MNLPRSIALVTGLTVVVFACFKVPYTGRKALNMVPDKLMINLSLSAYDDMLSDEKILKKGTDKELLDRVGKRISRQANRSDYVWETSLIDDAETINAWALPGGKIAFYTGIQPVLKNESGMAFVMGHEVGHAIARHGGERLSQQMALLGGLAGAYGLLETKTKLNTEQKLVVLGAVGAVAEVGVMLPFSRAHESEADVIGTMYMAGAGYPPGEAVKLWGRMERQTGGSGVPAFLSTHPANEKRQEVIREWLPRAEKRYERNKLTKDTLQTLW